MELPTSRGAIGTRDPFRARVLVVDDDPVTCMLLIEVLERQGFRVELAIDGRSGLDRALTGHHSAILLDYQLPDIMGLDLLKALRAKGVAAPIIMITGRGNEDVAFEAAQLGAARYIKKSFRPAELTRSASSATTVTVGTQTAL